jgi:putative SOS response-associated peptidase YedK
VPADAFYEWTGEKGFRQPHAIAMKDRHLFAFAGLCEGWKDPAANRSNAAEAAARGRSVVRVRWLAETAFVGLVTEAWRVVG